LISNIMINYFPAHTPAVKPVKDYCDIKSKQSVIARNEAISILYRETYSGRPA
jgi:hypothetical protein